MSKAGRTGGAGHGRDQARPGYRPGFVVQENLAEIREPLIAASLAGGHDRDLWFGFGVLILFWIKRVEARISRAGTDRNERLALIQHFEYLHKYANDVVFPGRFGIRLIEANDRALAVYAYTERKSCAFAFRSPLSGEPGGVRRTNGPSQETGRPDF